MFPQSVTQNVLRQENGGVLENSLVEYDNHLANNLRHFNRATTTNTHHPHLSSHRFFDVSIEGVKLVDGFPLLLTMHTKVDAEPSISFNDGEYYPIVSASGNRIPGGQIAGTTILLVWNSNLMSWILMSTSDTNDITKIAIPSYSEYVYTATEDGENTFVVPGFDKNDCALEINYGQTILRRNKDFEFPVGTSNTVRLRNFSIEAGDRLVFRITSYEMVAKSSAVIYNIEVNDVDMVATSDGQSAFALPVEVQNANMVDFNYMQTVLRNGLDYEINGDRSQLTLKEFTLDEGEVLVAHMFTLVERDANTISQHWNVPGQYTYEIKTVHGSYTATEDNIIIVPVPGFLRSRDEIIPIFDNRVLVYDVDYNIDELNQIVLHDAYALNTGDVLHYTIFQGAIQDTPPFVILTDTGANGQHLVLDTNYDLLRDGFTVVVKLKHRLVGAPTIKCIDGPAEPILDSFGAPVTGGYIAGSYLWCVYNEKKHIWYSMSHGHYDVSETMAAFEYAEGDANFIGGDVSYADLGPGHIGEIAIPHGLHTTPTDVEIHPTGHPGFLENPYEKPTSEMVLGEAGDNVRWVQWALWNLKYVGLGVTLSDWVTGQYDARTDTAIQKWQYDNNLTVESKFSTEDINVMDNAVKGTKCVIGDTWATADETNIYVGNTGNATSAFHWIATTSAGNADYKTSINEAVEKLVKMIRTYPGNYNTRFFNYYVDTAGTYNIVVPEYNPTKEKIYLVNYGQTVLREGVDYELTDTGIELTRIRLPLGELVQIVLIEQGFEEWTPEESPDVAPGTTASPKAVAERIVTSVSKPVGQSAGNLWLEPLNT